jgi:hypothetical protein
MYVQPIVAVGNGVLDALAEMDGESVGTGTTSPGFTVCATHTGTTATSIVITPTDVMPQTFGTLSRTPSGRVLSKEDPEMRSADKGVKLKSFCLSLPQNRQSDKDSSTPSRRVKAASVEVPPMKSDSEMTLSLPDDASKPVVPEPPASHRFDAPREPPGLIRTAKHA